MLKNLSQKLLENIKSFEKKRSFIPIIITVVFVITGVYRIWVIRGNEEKESEETIISDIELMDSGTYGLDKKTKTDSESDEPDVESDEYATSHNEEKQIPEEVSFILTDEPIELADIYTASGLTAVFKCYRPGAEQYTWETYDIYSRNWIEASKGDVTLTKDELNRNVSVFKVAATQENDGLIIRCRVDFQPNPIEPIVEMAALYILKDDIKNISVSDYEADSGRYINVKDIPINVTYADGSNDEIKGLNGVYFLEETEESRDVSIDAYGNPVETLTVIKKYHEYVYLTPSEQEAAIRYQNGDTAIDVPVTLTGEDKETPVILKLEINEKSSDDEPSSATVTITAIDNSTPYPELEYAFLPESEELKEEHWIKKPSFDIEISEGRQWIAYCRDKNGNIAFTSLSGDESDETTTSPSASTAGLELSVRLESDVWSRYNKIIVNVEKADEAYEYRYMLTENEDSGWISQAEYTVHANGTYKVYVRDTAGNISETEIAVSNIDNNPPVIQFIREKEKENEE